MVTTTVLTVLMNTMIVVIEKLNNSPLHLIILFVFPRLEYAKSCSELNDASGSFPSLTIDSDNVFKNAAQKTIVAISVQSNHIIWLSFSKFKTKENHSVKVGIRSVI